MRFQNNVAESHDVLAREIAALDHMLRTESQALKQRVALLHEALEDRQAERTDAEGAAPVSNGRRLSPA